MLEPANEYYNVAPDSRLEKFFHLIMLMQGDPEHRGWIERNAVRFYQEYAHWLNTSTREEGPVSDRYPDGPCALLQYFVWYDREKARVDGRAG